MSAAEWVGWVVIVAMTLTVASAVLAVIFDILTGRRAERRALVTRVAAWERYADQLEAQVSSLTIERDHYMGLLETELRKS